MAGASLTAERLRELLEYDPVTGVFKWRVAAGRWGRIPAGSVAGSVNKVHKYIYITIAGTVHKAHRLAWLYVHGEWPQDQIDHINGYRADNRLCNLRPATNAQNMENKKRYRSNTSGFPGVTWHPRLHRWQARIGVGGKRRHLGYWATAFEAHLARVEAKSSFHTFSPNQR